MSLNATTSSGLNPYAAGDEAKPAQVLFDANSTSIYSKVFTVNQEPVYVQAFNLIDSDILTVQMVDGVGSVTEYADFCPIFGAITLTPTRTKVKIDFPGRYRLKYSVSGPGDPPPVPVLGGFKVVCFAGTMTQEPNSDMAEALHTLLVTLTPPAVLATYVQGSAPIAVSGDGSLATPYVVSLNTTAAQICFVQGSVPIQVVGNGSSTTPYIISLNAGGGIAGLVNVVGTAPVIVTGNGAFATPYNVGVNLASDAQEEAGIPANYVISAGVLKHIVNATTGNQTAVLGVTAGVGNLGETSVGFQSGVNSAGLTYPTFVGHRAGRFNLPGITGSDIIAIGHEAAPLFVVGDYSGSIFIGGNAGTGISSAQNVVVIGNTAGNGGLTNGSVAIGHSAGSGTANGTEAVFVGEEAGSGGTTGTNVTAIGWRAGRLAVAAQNSTFVGNMAGAGALSSTGNCVFVGQFAGQNSNFLEGCIAIGVNAGLNVDYSALHPSPPDPSQFTRSIFIGTGAGANETNYDVIVIGNDVSGQLNASANHQIVLGTTSQTQLVTAGSIISGGAIGPSDERLKKNVEKTSKTLDLVNKLNPVTFDWDERALCQANLPHLKSDMPKRHYGVIAQQFETVFPEMVEVVNHNFGDYKYVRYERLVPVLLAAIQELSSKVDTLEHKLAKSKTKGEEK